MRMPFRLSIQLRPNQRLGRAALLVVTLGLAIAVNTVLFSIVDLLVIRPLPMAEPERVGFVVGVDAAQGNARARSSMEDYLDFVERSRSFEELAAARRSSASYVAGGVAERLIVEETTASLFSAWGLRTEIGRPLSPADDAPGAPAVALLSHRTWRERFGASRDVLGRTLMIDGVARTVVGVMPPAVEIGNLRLIEVWMPLGPQRGKEPRERRDLTLCGRLVAGVDHEQASAEIAALSAELRREHPETNGGWSARVLDARDGLVGEGAWFVLGLLGVVVGGVLIVACANVANVLFAELGERSAEMATRAALGASAARIVRGLLAEQLRIAALAALLGLALARLALRLLAAVSYEPIWSMLAINARVLAFVVVLATASVALAGLAPALDAARGNLAAILGSGDVRGATSRRGARLRRVVAAAQLSAAIAVVVPASLANRSIRAETTVDWGFAPAGKTAAGVELPAGRYPTADSRRAFAERLREQLALAAPRDRVAFVEPLPIVEDERLVGLEVPGIDALRPEDRPRANLVVASPGLFATLGVELLEGEALSGGTAGVRPRAVVNRAFARRYFTGRSVPGQTLRLADPLADIDEVEIAGVVGDVMSPDLTAPAPPTLYLPFEAVAPSRFGVVVRGVDETASLGALRRALAAVDPLLALEHPASFRQLDLEQRSSNYTIAGMFAAFAGIALALAIVGLYAIASYSVSRRQREIGVRMALGADRRKILGWVLADGARLVAWGGAAGLAVGAGLAQVMRSRLYGISTLDPVTFGGAAVALALFALVALAAPARRAARADPASLLRVR